MVRGKTVLKKIKDRVSIAQVHLLLLFVLLLCIFQYGITKIYGMYLFPDEFGYWASAATALGYDWSEITALGSYYSFGYSAVLIPILKFIENATNAYRTAILLNAMFSGISLYLIYHIFTKVFKGTEYKLIACISGIAVFYPSCIYYMQMTMTESLLTVLFLAISAVLLRYIENPRGFTAVWLAVLLIYIYFVHMRTVGIVAACCLTLMVLAFWNRKYTKPLLVFGVTVGILAFGGMFIKQLVTGILYSAATTESLATNDYVGQVDKITALFSFKGIYQFATSCIGKLFYLGSATFGIFYYGIGYLSTEVLKLIQCRKRKEPILDCTMWFLFLALAVLFQFLITAIYTMETGSGGRMDMLLYGRYNEILVPIILCLGIFAMLQSKNLIKHTAIIIVLHGLLAPVIYYLIRSKELTELYTCHIVGISYAVNETNFHVELFLRNIFLVTSLFHVVTAVIIYCIQKKKELYWLLSIVIAVEVFFGISASKNDIFSHNEDNFRDYELAESIVDLGREGNEIIFLDSGGTTYIDLIQFCLRDTKFHVIATEKFQMDDLEADDMVLTTIESPYAKQLRAQFDGHLDSRHFDLYYSTEEKR